MKLRPVSAFALFGGLISAYGVGISLMPLKTGLFKLDVSRLITDAQSAKAAATLLRIADGLSMRMLATSAFALACFVAIAYVDMREAKRAVLRQTTASEQ